MAGNTNNQTGIDKGVDKSAEYDPEIWRVNYAEKARQLTSVEPFPLYDILDRAAQEFPTRPCTSIDGRVMTYAEVHEFSLRAAAGLKKLGIGQGDHVGYCMPNSPVYTVFSFALWRLGAAIVGLNPLYPATKVVAQARDAHLKAVLISDDAKLAPHAAALGQMPEQLKLIACASQNEAIDTALPAPVAGVDTIACCDVLACEDSWKPVEFDLSDTVAALQYTGGTTGEPKAAMLTHANLSINVQQMHAWFSNLERGKEVLLAAAPFTHVSGVGPIQNFTAFPPQRLYPR